MKFLVAIPAYNCEKQIVRVLDSLKNIKHPALEYFLVIDNYSDDATFSAAKVFSNQEYKIIQNQQNLGLGGSFRVALSYALENKFTHLIWFHGDDQASASDLLNMVSLIQNEKTIDFLYGARFMPSSQLINYSSIRNLGNRGLNLLATILLGRRIYDLGSGLNIYNVKAFENADVELWPDHLAFDMKILFLSCQSEFDTRFFPIEWKCSDQTSNAKNLIVGIRILKMLFLNLFSRK